jgi:hypothetical protein
MLKLKLTKVHFPNIFSVSKNLKVFLLLSLPFLAQLYCCTTDPKLEPDLLLKLKDVTCTEAWLQLTTNNIQLPATINLLKNNSVSQVFNLNTQDSILYIDSLMPNQNYSFQVSSIQSAAGGQVSSNKVQAQTLDTTSHNFSWQTFEFGVITNQSHLFDVAIINENNIWAVGEIYMNDSLGNLDPNAYNAIHWDGASWELKRIKTNACGGVDYPPIKAIFAFSSNDIIFAHIDGSISHFNGIEFTNDCSLITQLNGSANKIWGRSRNDFYVVSGIGFIAHYQNGSWTKIESGTSFFLSDIAINNLGEIFICGGNPSFGQGVILKSSVGNNFSSFVEGANIPESQLFNPKLYGSFSSIWFDKNNTLYSGGNILFQNKFNKWSYVKSLPENFIGGNPGVYYRGYITKVRGNASNDMWIVGDRNTLRHFNGVTWQQIGIPYDPQIDLVWRGMACKDDNTIIVGTHNRSAIIMMIKK